MKSNLTVSTSSPSESVKPDTPVSGASHESPGLWLPSQRGGESESSSLVVDAPSGCGFNSLYGEAVEAAKAWVSGEELFSVCPKVPSPEVLDSSYFGSYLRTNLTQSVVSTGGEGVTRYDRLFDLSGYALSRGFSHEAVVVIMAGLMTSHAVFCGPSTWDGAFYSTISWSNPFSTSAFGFKFRVPSTTHFDYNFGLVALESVHCEVQVVGLMESLTNAVDYGLSSMSVMRMQNYLASYDVDEAMRVGRESFSRLVNAKGGGVFYSLERDDLVVSSLLRSTLLHHTRGLRGDPSLPVMPDGPAFVVKIYSLTRFVRVVDCELARALAVVDRRGWFDSDEVLGSSGRTAKQVFDRLEDDGLLAKSEF